MKSKLRLSFFRIAVLLFVTVLLFQLPLSVFASEDTDIPYPIADGLPGTLAEAIEYFRYSRIGIQTGTSFEGIAMEIFPDADLQYYANGTDLKMALLGGKIDAFLLDDQTMITMRHQDPSVTFYDEYLSSEDMAFAFNKQTGRKLCEQMNVFLAEARESGLLTELGNKWFLDDGSAEMETDILTLPDINGTLQVVSEISYPPFQYYTNSGRIGGFEMELLCRFAQKYGYAVKISDVVFTTVVMSVTAGKADIGSSGLSITEERRDSVLFSDPFYKTGGVLCVPAAAQDSASLLDSLVNGFRKTFVVAGRWKLFLDGMLTTLMISAMSVLFGTVLGFGIFSLNRKGNRAVGILTEALSRLVHGIPVVVFLLLMYYLVFGKSRLDGKWISVIAFTILFSFDTASLLTNGNRVVDRGQTEAAYMLGYSERGSFYKVILPQIINVSLSGYIGAVISLLHASAIVGYIAVEDITKVSDIVRGRTYEAFFPLIVTAVAYFLMAWLFTFGLKCLQKRLDPESRKIRIREVSRND